jgi:hypothetical protein
VRETRPSQKAVTLLATTFVLLGGMVTLAFMILTATDDPLPKLVWLAAGTGGFAVLLWLLRDRQPGTGARWQLTWLRRKTASAAAWRAAFRRPQPEAPPQPPTAEKVRELSQNTSTWVPSSRPRP